MNLNRLLGFQGYYDLLRPTVMLRGGTETNC